MERKKALEINILATSPKKKKCQLIVSDIVNNQIGLLSNNADAFR